ncbi:hypothetical protein BN7_894 [Wickerhamomyces ciferrii]|uniref:Uncharacterized protein n=1 Tax=Wickerhamomyces ciferrii (strain ATCC 14091 / BCRC 22168 / CBS 111 / JCM 3599 / NBRC 0793 / NRRL Y-1031 F-60-10) TaxID=1206466 RepID=K0K911_WICCF|nr:uncharacterized protein BN7_894 [Wickerhamomyces ciferrii]CCH41355.1 hypothetical protein BN7_894 [Wickerhamomyces ciferrii]
MTSSKDFFIDFKKLNTNENLAAKVGSLIVDGTISENSTVDDYNNVSPSLVEAVDILKQFKQLHLQGHGDNVLSKNHILKNAISKDMKLKHVIECTSQSLKCKFCNRDVIRIRYFKDAFESYWFEITIVKAGSTVCAGPKKQCDKPKTQAKKDKVNEGKESDDDEEDEEDEDFYDSSHEEFANGVVQKLDLNRLKLEKKLQEKIVNQVKRAVRLYMEERDLDGIDGGVEGSFHADGDDDIVVLEEEDFNARFNNNSHN